MLSQLAHEKTNKLISLHLLDCNYSAMRVRVTPVEKGSDENRLYEYLLRKSQITWRRSIDPLRKMDESPLTLGVYGRLGGHNRKM